MPIFNNNSLDDTPVFDACPSFEGGMVSSLRSNLLQPNQVAECKNMDISKFGTLTTRRGTVKIGSGAIGGGQRIQGLCWFNSQTYNLLVAVCNQIFYKFDGSNWTTVSGYTATSATADCEIVQLLDKIYITDGTLNLFEWTGFAFNEIKSPDYANPLPAGCKYLTAHTKRLFAYGRGVSSDTIYVSDILDATTWGATNSVRVGGGEGDPIVACVPWIDFNLVVLKNKSIWVINTDPAQTDLSKWTISLVHGEVGCIAHRSAAQVGDDIWFLSRDGVRSVRRVQSQNQNEVSIPLSAPIQDLIDRINWNTASKSCGVFWNNRYLLCVPVDGASDPNYTLVYNTITQSWAGYWTGWTPTVFEKTGINQNLRLVFGQTDGKTLQWQDYVTEDAEAESDFQDDGANIASGVTTRSLVFADLFCAKKGSHFELEFFRSNSLANVYVAIDQGGDSLAWSGSTSGQSLNLPFFLPANLIPLTPERKALDLLKYDPFREVQFKIQTISGKLALRSLIASAFVDTLQLES
jgi:hypothetical protein